MGLRAAAEEGLLVVFGVLFSVFLLQVALLVAQGGTVLFLVGLYFVWVIRYEVGIVEP